ncbi:MAG TPA: hypothetical protein VJH34_01385 [archaeon]|nr:hypothetical protein [archaeon]
MVIIVHDINELRLDKITQVGNPFVVQIAHNRTDEQFLGIVQYGAKRSGLNVSEITIYHVGSPDLGEKYETIYAVQAYKPKKLPGV